jgi:hypothetical protein
VKAFERDAPEGITAQWFVNDDGDLVIEVSPKLDEVTRRRYIEQAKSEYGLDRKRRVLIPFLPGRSGRHASRARTVGIATAATVAAAGVAAAAAVVPVALNGHDNSSGHHRSAIAAPPPSRHGPALPPGNGTPSPDHSPSRRDSPPAPPPNQPGPATEPTQSPDRAANKPAVDKPPKHTRRPTLPGIIPTVSVPPVLKSPPVDAKPRPSTETVLLCARLHVGELLWIQLGCGHLLQAGRP